MTKIIRVFNPSVDIPNVLFQYNPKVLNSLVLDASKVTQQNDVSGNALNISQPTSTMQPLYDGIINGFPAINYDGTDDSLSHTLISPYQGASEIYIIYQSTKAQDDSAAIFSSATALSANRFQIDYRGSTGVLRFAFRESGGTVRTFDIESVANQDPHLVRVKMDGVDKIDTYLDGVFASTFTSATGFNPVYDILKFGEQTSGGKNFGGYIGESLGYTGKLTESDSETLSRYLMNGWSI